jgi:hypothetical protein
VKRKGAQSQSQLGALFQNLIDPPLPFPSFLETTPKMSKVILSTLVAALVCVAGSAKAANGISSSTLGQMGLTGLSVMSDSDALAIRGLGFTGVDHSINSSCCGPRGSASPSTLAAGHSTATMNINAGMGDDCPTCTQTGSSHSENAYLAAGPYSASGSNYSEAGSTITKSETVEGVGALATSCSSLVWAGGNSSAKGF